MLDKTTIEDTPPVTHIDQLQAALFYLMTHHSFNQCPKVAAAIVDHLHMLLRHPHIELMPKQQAVLAKLLNKWRLHRLQDSGGSSSFGRAH